MGLSPSNFDSTKQAKAPQRGTAGKAVSIISIRDESWLRVQNNKLVCPLALPRHEVPAAG